MESKCKDKYLLHTLCIAYASITFGRVILGVVSPRLTDSNFLKDDSFLNYGTLQGCATGSYCIGKMFWALVSDKLGGFNNIWICILGVSLSGFMCGFSQTPLYLAIAWSLQMFFSSGVWGGVANIRDQYPENSYGRCFSLLGFCSRLGATIGALMFTPMLALFEWRIVYLIGFSIVACVGGMCIFRLYHVLYNSNMGLGFGVESLNPLVSNNVGGEVDVELDVQDRPEGLGLSESQASVYCESEVDEEGRLTTGTNIGTDGGNNNITNTGENKVEGELEEELLMDFIWRCMCEVRCWVVIAIAIILTTVMEFQSFVPLFLEAQFGLGATLGGYGSAFFTTGAMLAPILVWSRYDHMEWEKRIKVMPLLVGFAAVMLIPLVILPSVMSGVTNGITVCVIGFILLLISGGIAGPYYIVAAEFALLMGGKSRSGFFVNLVDAVSYIGAIVFDVGGYAYATEHGWSGVVLFLSLISMICTMLLAYYFNLPKLPEFIYVHRKKDIK